MRVKTVPVKAMLVCRGCRGEFERVLNLPEGVSPPKDFECAVCTKNRSIIDVENPDALIATGLRGGIIQAAAWKRYAEENLPGVDGYLEFVDGTFANIDRYGPYRDERKRRAAARSRQRHPELDRERKWQRTSAGLFTREEWHARVGDFNWRCSVCGLPVTPETVRCGHALPDGGDGLENRVPLCRPCQCRQAARLARKSSSHLASACHIKIIEGEESAESVSTSASPENEWSRVVPITNLANLCRLPARLLAHFEPTGRPPSRRAAAIFMRQLQPRSTSLWGTRRDAYTGLDHINGAPACSRCRGRAYRSARLPSEGFTANPAIFVNHFTS